MVLPRFIEAAKRDEPLKVFGDGKQTRCFGFVHDVVEALVRLQNCEKARGEIFNIGGTEEISILELAKLVVETLGLKSKIELIPYDQAYAPGFDDMRRRKPPRGKTGTLREVQTANAAARDHPANGGLGVAPAWPESCSQKINTGDQQWQKTTITSRPSAGTAGQIPFEIKVRIET